MANPVAHTRLDTRDLPQATAFELFREATSATHDVSRVEGDRRPFKAVMQVWYLGDAVVVDGDHLALNYDRSVEKAMVDTLDSYVFLMLRTGSWTGNAGERELTVGPGEIVAFDRTLPIKGVATDCTFVTVALARTAVETHLGGQPDLHGRIVDGPAGRMFADHLCSLSRELSTLDTTEAAGVVKATLSLAVACLSRLPQTPETAEGSLRHRAMRHISRSLQDMSLSPQALIEQLGCSRSSLYRAFRPFGGPQGYIRSRRLEAVHVLLNDPAERRTIAELAYGFGFVSIAHFSTAFRRRFGFQPSAARRRGPAHEPSSAEARKAYHAWSRKIASAEAEPAA